MTEADVAIISELDKICRTCLSEKRIEELRPIFDNSLNTQITDLTSVKVEPHDGLPIHICNDCAFTLTVALNFKNQCQKSDSQLRSALHGHNALYRSIDALVNHAEVQTSVQTQHCQGLGLELPLLNDVDNKVELAAIEITNKSQNSENTQIIYLKGNIDVPQQDDLLKNNLIDKDTESVKIDDDNDDNASDLSESLEDSLKHGRDVVELTSNQLSQLKFCCEQCGKLFKYEANLKSHLIKHGTKLKCEVCNKEFDSMKCLRDHLKTHKDYRPYPCKICPKTFTLATGLVKHMRIHNGDKKHLCTVCGKRFYEPNHLNIHMRIHTGEKPLVCSTCGKRFSSPHGLMVHNKTHTGERRFECNVC
ncbi:hypothetical protein NQ315_013120, partial [Exocentrus adspersus]